MFSSDSTFQMIESALSPPYDGSEFEELFPELTGVEPEEMVDVEALADSALESLAGTCGGEEMFAKSDRSSPLSLTNDMENLSDDSDEDPEQMLRYIIGQTDGTKTSQKRKRSHDSASSLSPPRCPSPSPSRGGSVRRKIKPPKTTVTIIDDDGIRREVEGPNRNAVMAKLNRERKKKLLSTLEGKVGLLSTENDALKKQNGRLRKKVGVLARELNYVKSVLANQSALSQLLTNIKATGLEFHSSMSVSVSNKKPEIGENNNSVKRKGLNRPSDHDYCLEEPSSKVAKYEERSRPNTSQRVKREHSHSAANSLDAQGAGVCLHVSDGCVSLEFCSKCSQKSKEAQSQSKLRTPSS
ncbi:uncharacterized protein [Diadema antillarum]|uniref:uncharacterized protein n=1 Tax=Diadema antillarum TaxID=105358 RepID=UPI003A8BCDE4